MEKFSDLDLDPDVLRAVEEAGYETPTPIQAQAIPHAMQGRDVLGIAQTGTGKTASFTLPMINALAKGRARARMPRSLVLCPTRELAAQVAESFETYAKYKKLSMALLIGGVSFKDQERLIDRGVDVLIATPGRLLDHFERGKLMLTGIGIMVIDEADRMLDMGFIPDIERIFKLTPFTRQTLFFSATMPPEIVRITNEFLHNPERVEVARQSTTAETIAQSVCLHQPARRDRADKDRREILRRMITEEGENLSNGIIFCNRKRDVDIVAKSLKKHGFDAAAIHGDLDQSLRTATLNGFREGKLRLLVASDVAARGLDIPDVSHVINFDVPNHAEDYVHRIGRTGRAGKSGKAMMISLPVDDKNLAKVEALIKTEIPRQASPLAAAKGDDRAEQPKPAKARKPRNEPRKDAPAKAEEQVAAEPAPAPKPQQPRRDADEQRGRGRGRGRGGNYREPRNTIVGMGNHVPAFLTREFRKPVKAVEDVAAADDVESVVETPEADAVQTPIVENPVKAADENGVPEDDSTEAAQHVPADDAEPEAEDSATPAN